MTQEVYSLLLPIVDSNLVLPNTSVAEVMPFVNVESKSNANKPLPDWVIGFVNWRGSRVPLLSIERINGIDDIGEVRRSRIAVVHTLNKNDKVPFIGILVQGIPRLVPATEDNCQEQPKSGKLTKGVKMHVQLEKRDAIVPDIDAIEKMIQPIV